VFVFQPRFLVGSLLTGACAAALALASQAGCSVVNAAPDMPTRVAETPDACSGQVYFRVPEWACTDFGCSAGAYAYALCGNGTYSYCSCELPCQNYSPAQGSAVPDAAPPPCDAGADADASDDEPDARMTQPTDAHEEPSAADAPPGKDG